MSLEESLDPPRLSAALPPEAVVERVSEILRSRAESVAAGTRELLDRLSKRAGMSAGRQAFVIEFQPVPR